jgi:23S rRNA pseudouridine2605 synthase
MTQRLQKILAEAGYGSRRACEEFIVQGRVCVNGKRVRDLGTCADALRDKITLDGERVRSEKKVYYVLNKPRGYLCTRSDERGRRTIYDLLRRVPQRLYTVGRLDADAEGLLLLTNDGDFSHRVAHPRAHVGKTYRVCVERALTPQARTVLERGMFLDGRKTLPARVLKRERRGRGEIVTIRIMEGRKHQIKRMLLAVGCPVKQLKRIAIGELKLGALPVGRYRRLGREEVERIFEVSSPQRRRVRAPKGPLWGSTRPRHRRAGPR